jgi:hypothetical protein
VSSILLHWWHQFSCFRYSSPLMTPVFMFSVFCSTDGTSFHVFGTLLHWWHQFLNWCHQWSRVPKTWKLVSLVEQSTENIKTGVISGVEYRKHENWCHQWNRVPFLYSTPRMTPVFMFSVLCSTDDTSFHVFGTLFLWWHQFSCFRYSAPPMTAFFMLTGVISGAEYRKHENWCHQWKRVPKT